MDSSLLRDIKALLLNIPRPIHKKTGGKGEGKWGSRCPFMKNGTGERDTLVWLYDWKQTKRTRCDDYSL